MGVVMSSRAIQEMKPGDFVKTLDGEFKEIASIYGMDENGHLEPPSRGGFGVITTDGSNITMWDARGYFKKDDPR
jgi:hypothetical protein